MTSLIVPYDVPEPQAMPLPDLGDRLPADVLLGMYIAAWARAEDCGVLIVDGHLELRCRFTPTPSLERAFHQHRAAVVGVIGFAVPILIGQGRRAFAASWWGTFGSSGEGSKN